MKSSVYKIVGCSGSKRWCEVRANMYAQDAHKEANRLNQDLAFRLGVSYRELKGRAGEWGRREGLHASGISGQDGALTGF